MKVICYGDSNTWGYDPRGYFGGRYENPWPRQLAEITGWTVVNQGENGREIPGVPVTFPEDTDLLIVMLGTNDLLQFHSPETVCRKLERFLTSVNLSRQRLRLLSPPPMILGEWVPDRRLIGNAAVAANGCQDLSRQLGVPFADPGQWNIPLAYDGVHFTEAGHRVFAAGLWEYLKKEAML